MELEVVGTLNLSFWLQRYLFLESNNVNDMIFLSRKILVL
jgi:hypothetical protein